MLERIAYAAQRRGIRRIGAQHGAIEANGILIPAERRQFARELELNTLIDLASARMRRILSDERGERISVNLFLARGGTRCNGRFLMVEDMKPLRCVVDGVVCVARGEEEETVREDPSHLPHKSSTS